MAPIRAGVRRSPSRNAASSVVQTGLVVSSENTVANGKSVMASAQPYCAAKCRALRTKCSPSRRGRISLLRSGRASRNATRMTIPKALRIDNISNRLKSGDRLRIEIAVVENDSTAAVIHSTTRPR